MCIRDSLGIEQGTSAKTDAFDGNENTFAIYDTKETTSPRAETVFDMWRYGQSAFFPSVAEMRLMYSARQTINPVIEKCGGVPPSSNGRVLVLDINGSGRATDSQSLALFAG